MSETANIHDLRQIRCPLLLVKVKQLILSGSIGDKLAFQVDDARLYSDLSKLTGKLHFSLSQRAISNHEWLLFTERLSFEQELGKS